MSEKKKPMVVFSQYSPYMLVDAPIKDYKSKETVADETVVSICRCGKSESKPFCDGTHSKIGFIGKSDLKREDCKVRSYKGKKITVFYDKLLCAKLGHCSRELPSVFSPGKKPWVNPDNAEIDKIINVIKKCASGALSYCLTEEDSQNWDTPVESEVMIRKSGPLCCNKVILKDDLGSDKKLINKERVCLCRCGESNNKPFCDGAHKCSSFENEKPQS